MVRILIRIRKDSHNSWKPDPDHHHDEKPGAVKAHNGAKEVPLEGLGIHFGKDPDPLKNPEPDPHRSEKSYPDTGTHQEESGSADLESGRNSSLFIPNSN